MIVGAGLSTLGSLKLEVFPEVASQMITVSVPYLGAAPVEVEEGVCLKVEEAVQDLEGIKRLTSTASEGVGTVLIEAEDDADVRKLLEEVKSRVDGIITFPELTERPIVQELALRFQVLNLALAGPADERTLKHWGEVVRDELTTLPSVTQVTLTSARPYEISIEVREGDLRRWGLTFDEVVAAVRNSSLDLPGGSVRTDTGEILLRTKGQAYRGREFEELVLRAQSNGTRLLLGDVATVVDGFAETDQEASFDGQPAVLLQVFRVGDQNALQIAREIDAYLVDLRTRLPEGLEATVWQDDTKLLQDRLELLLRNGRVGLLLVFVVLALFLRLRLAIWVAVGIAVSFTGALWLMPYFDVSINIMSLFAFIVVLGIVVDDAIVIGENIYRHSELGKEGLAAAIGGAQEVAIPVIFSILTSVAAFSTLLNAPGAVGKVIAVVPIIAMATLFFSMVESLLILPSHLSHIPAADHAARGEGPWARIQGFTSRSLGQIRPKVYAPILERALEWRYMTIAAAFVMLMLTIGAVVGGWVKFDYFPDVAADNAVAVLTMPQGTPASVTDAAMTRIEESARRLEKELQNEGYEDVYRHLLRTVGDQPFSARTQAQAGFVASVGVSGSHLGEVNIELSPSEERDISSEEIAFRGGVNSPATFLPRSSCASIRRCFLRATTSACDFPHAISSTCNGQPPISRKRCASTRASRSGRLVPAGKAGDPARDRTAGRSAGLTLSDIATQVRHGFYGAEAQRIQRGRDDVRVMVRYSRDERSTLSTLEQMRLRGPGGVEMPFSQAATAELDRGYSTITRVDRQRTIDVTANTDPGVASAGEIRRDLEQRLLPEVLARHPGVTFSWSGQQEEQAESLDGAIAGFAMALAIIFVLLAIPFRSYVQPMIVMSVIPFGLIGAVLGHVLMGMNLTMLSIFGVIALTGVVVNDSLVLVDFVNRAVRSGRPLVDAVRQAGVVRFRPILLTSLTTFAGLTPLLLERSLQAQFLKPMAAALGFGVLFATPIVLILVPAQYLILHDLIGVFRKATGREEPVPEPVPQGPPGAEGLPSRGAGGAPQQGAAGLPQQGRGLPCGAAADPGEGFAGGAGRPQGGGGLPTLRSHSVGADGARKQRAPTQSGRLVRKASAAALISISAPAKRMSSARTYVR